MEALAAFELSSLGDGTCRTIGELLTHLRDEVDGEKVRLRQAHE